MCLYTFVCCFSDSRMSLVVAWTAIDVECGAFIMMS